ncbi:site-2 protease family protein [Erythrobacter sanguineus]|uniref:Zn-dependent protease (Includes SpoIVFB) n=1 Tax=Erythrobacter sanguineus TaxID=198312 RepID=A0A1M7T1Y4_9SPHN|nr:site-2 protease family protein [Erythrobacter sanguineus]SHN64728.1 Zn-dependent protease (includes SpoIVFB) [Erythrobacter sanguineus]
MSETFIFGLVLIPALIVAIVFHEVAHGYMARLLGDPTASERGRLTLNPIAHVDPIGTLLVPGALALLGGPVFGWAKPVPVNKWRLDNPRYGMMAVAAAGPGSNFVLASVGAVLLGLSMPAGLGFGGDMEAGAALLVNGLGEPQWLATGLFYFILVNIFLGLFNLLPIPPFDGSHIVGGLLPERMRAGWEKLQGVGMALLIALIAASWVFGTSWLGTVLMPPVTFAMGFYLSLADWIAALIA